MKGLTKSDITTFVFKECHAVYYIDKLSDRSGLDAGRLVIIKSRNQFLRIDMLFFSKDAKR